MSTMSCMQSVELEREERKEDASDRGWSGLRQPWVRPALIVGCGIAMFTQLSGIEMIIYYAPTILTDNGFSTSDACSGQRWAGRYLPDGDGGRSCPLWIASVVVGSR